MSRHHDVITKHSDVTIKHGDITAKQSDITTKHGDISKKQSDVTRGDVTICDDNKRGRRSKIRNVSQKFEEYIAESLMVEGIHRGKNTNDDKEVNDLTDEFMLVCVPSAEDVERTQVKVKHQVKGKSQIQDKQSHKSSSSGSSSSAKVLGAQLFVSRWPNTNNLYEKDSNSVTQAPDSSLSGAPSSTNALSNTSVPHLDIFDDSSDSDHSVVFDDDSDGSLPSNIAVKDWRPPKPKCVPSIDLTSSDEETDGCSREHATSHCAVRKGSGIIKGSNYHRSRPSTASVQDTESLANLQVVGVAVKNSPLHTKPKRGAMSTHVVHPADHNEKVFSNHCTHLKSRSAFQRPPSVRMPWN